MPNNDSSRRIVSNYDYVVLQTNLINSKTNNPCYNSEPTELQFRGNGDIYTIINQCLKTYFMTTSSLLSKLSKETETMNLIAEQYKEIDNELGREAGEL